MNSTRGAIILACVLSVALAAGASNLYADPIVSINGHLVDTLFVPAGGTFGMGVLTLEKTTAVTVVRTGGTTSPTFHFLLTTNLQNDASTGGIADGIFSGGSLLITSPDLLTTYLAGTIQTLELDEPLDNQGILSGGGTFVVTGGTYQADFGNAGKTVQITFHVTPKVMNDFSGTFTGTTDITLTPTFGGVPEPTTLLLMGTGAIGLFGYLRRRRIQ